MTKLLIKQKQSLLILLTLFLLFGCSSKRLDVVKKEYFEYPVISSRSESGEIAVISNERQNLYLTRRQEIIATEYSFSTEDRYSDIHKNVEVYGEIEYMNVSLIDHKTLEVIKVIDLKQILEENQDYHIRNIKMAYNEREKGTCVMFPLVKEIRAEDTIEFDDATYWLRIDTETSEYTIELASVGGAGGIQLSFPLIQATNLASSNDVHFKVLGDKLTSNYRVIMNSEDMPESAKLYDVLPDLKSDVEKYKQENNLDDVTLTIMIPGVKDSYELLSYFIEAGSEITWEGVYINSTFSINGKSESISSFQDFMQFFEYSDSVTNP